MKTNSNSDLNAEKISKMRPKALHDRALLLRKRCGEEFFKKFNSEFVSVECPGCGAHTGIPRLFNKYGFRHCRCKNCKTLFCSPRPQEDLLTCYYDDYDAPAYWTTLLVATDSHRKAIQYAPRAEKIADLIKKRGISSGMSACDVGAGSGAFALALKNTGFFSQVVALDLSQKCVDACRGVGLEARLGSVGDLEPESVGLLTMNDVIEHVFSPVAFLKQARNVLRSGGLIAIATPNGEGFDFKILGKKTVNITPPEHLQYFNPVSMKILLERTGFEVLVNETPGVLDIQIVVREINNRNLKLSINNNWLNYLLLETDDITVTNFQRFLSENSLSSHLFVIARKQSL